MRRVPWDHITYWLFLMFLFTPPFFVVGWALCWLGSWFHSLLPSLPVRTTAEELQFTLQSLAIAAPVIAVAVAVICLWMWWERRGGRSC